MSIDVDTAPAPTALAETRRFADYTPRKAEKAEMAVIGAIVQSEKAFNEVAAVIDGEQFFHPLHKSIFEIVRKVQQSGQTVTPLEVLAAFDGPMLRLTRNGAYLYECIEGVPTVANGAYFARQVLAAAQLREAAEHAVRAMQLTASSSLDDVANTIELIRDSAEKLGRSGGLQPTWTSWDQLAQESVEELKRLSAAAETNQAGGIPTGWPEMDQLLSGMQEGQVIVMAGRPGSGKTVGGLNVVQHVAMRLKVPAAFFSLEMSKLECGLRLLSAGSGVPLKVLRDGALDKGDWGRIARYLFEVGEKAPLFIDDTPSITMAHADAQMYRLEAMGIKPKVVVFDYLQLIKATGKSWSREQEVASISREMKLFAKKWKCTVILLAQLNRGPEQRTEKIPVLSDLRESGSVEQDADVVVLLYRPDYYDKESPRAGEVDFIVAKHRGGPTDTITMAAKLHVQQFEGMAIL